MRIAVEACSCGNHFYTFPTTPPRARQEAPNVRRAAMFTGAFMFHGAFQMGLIHLIAGMRFRGHDDNCVRV